MPRRILLLITDLEIGGTPTVVRELATRLNSPDASVEVACLAKWGPVADELRDAGIVVTALNARGSWDFFSARRQLARLVREGKIDTVLSFLIHANAVAAAARCPDVRFLQSIQTTQEKPRWHWWVQRFVHSRAAKIVVPSPTVARVAQERSGIDPHQIVVIPNAVDPARFERVEVFKTPTIRVGFIGRLDPVKNIGALVSAMYFMNDLPVECHIFGEGPERGRLQELIDRYGFRDRVFLHGSVPRPQDALRQMDVLVLPSLGEGFGLVLIEAMASGVPVIGAKRGAIADVIEDGENGLLVGHNYFDREIAYQVRRLKDDAALREKLIKGGLRTVREKFNWDVVLPRYRELLQI